MMGGNHLNPPIASCCLGILFCMRATLSADDVSPPGLTSCCAPSGGVQTTCRCFVQYQHTQKSRPLALGGQPGPALCGSGHTPV